jgi:mRNA interferase MazF
MPVLRSVTCAPITRTIRGIRSEVEVGPSQGLPQTCAIDCDHVLTVPQGVLDPQPVGRLDEVGRGSLDRALRYARHPVLNGIEPGPQPQASGPEETAKRLE